jgi:hypothetical protein
MLYTVGSQVRLTKSRILPILVGALSSAGLEVATKYYYAKVVWFSCNVMGFVSVF